MINFVSYENAQEILTKVTDKINKIGAVTFKGSVAFSGLPATPDSTMIGWMYNVNEDFTTDSRFVEGSGKKYKAGENVIVDDLSTYAAASPVGSENPCNHLGLFFITPKSNSLNISNKKSPPLEHIIALTLSSFIEIAYNNETQTIDTTKISVILSSTLGILLGFLVPIIIFKIIINKLFISKKTIRLNLSDDLSYIYLNFNKYKNQLSKDQ